MVLAVVSAYAGTNQAIIVSAPQLENLDLMAVDTAADVTVIDRVAIEDSGSVSVPELLQSEANILIRNVTGAPNSGQISMRGFGENSHLRTLIMVDGHKINRPDMGPTSWESIPLSNIEKIEVIRGGQNVLYGDAALAGVVKITTKRGADAGTQVGGEAGSFGYLSGHISHGGSAGNVDYSAGVHSYTSDGFRSNSVSRATTLSGSMVWYAGELDTLSARVSYTDSAQEFPGPLDYDQMQDDPTRVNPGNTGRSEGRKGLATLIWETERDWGAARVTSGFNFRDLDGELGGIFANNQQTGLSLGPRLKWGGDEDFIIGGVDLRYDGLKYEDYLPADLSLVSAHADLDRISVQPYLFAQHKTRDNWILGTGARFDYTRTDNLYEDYVDSQLQPVLETNRGPIPNPNYKNPPDLTTNSYSGVVSKQGWAASLSLAKEFSRAWEGWLRYDRVYRYPSLDEVAAYQGFALNPPLNDDLEPESGDNIELGTRLASRHWNAGWTVYGLAMDNEIVYVEIPQPSGGFLRKNANLGKTIRYGTDIELQYGQAWYGASTRWTIQDAVKNGGENDGNRVPLVPWLTGTCNVWFDPFDALRLSLNWIYVSEQYKGGDISNSEDKLEAYGLLGFTAGVQMSDTVSLKISIHNLLDETYASTAYSTAYYPGAGRSFRMGLNMEF